MCTCHSLYFKGFKSISFLTTTNFVNQQRHDSLNMFQYCPEDRFFFPLEWHNFSRFHHVQTDCGGFLILPSSPPVSHFAPKSTECSPQLTNRLYQLTKINTRDFISANRYGFKTSRVST